jgi:L-iditol 2-dehydrogenase
MQVVRLHGAGDLRLHDEPMPSPGTGESLVRVTAVSICGSDIHWFAEGGIGDSHVKQPLVLGHEFAGVIADGERSGERVAIDPAIACGVCEFCLEGNPNFCTSMRFAGDGKFDGALREYVAWPAHCLFRLPDSIGNAEGALLEPLGVGIHAIDLGHLRPGMSVGIFGCGPIGLLMVQLARMSGATRIIATDKLPHRLQAAQSFGATDVFQAEGGHENVQILSATCDRGVDVAFEVAGENDAVETAVAVAKRGARVILVGIPADDRTAFNASTARRKGLTIKMVRRMKHTYPRAISLVERGLVDVHSLVTHRFLLTEAKPALVEAEKRSGLKVVIELLLP